MNPIPVRLRRLCQRRAFTLVELLVSISILGLLAGLAFPFANRVVLRARVAKSVSNLHQIGVAVGLYASEQGGMVPCVRGDANVVSRAWDTDPYGARWVQELNYYLIPGRQAAYWDLGQWGAQNGLSPVFKEPLYGKLVTSQYAGGYSWNSRLGLAQGLTYGQWSPESSFSKRYNLASLPGDAVLAMFGRYEGSSCDNQGVTELQPMGGSKSNKDILVDHTRRIGMDARGARGESGLYLHANLGVQQLTPDQAKAYLKLRQP